MHAEDACLRNGLQRESAERIWKPHLTRNLSYVFIFTYFLLFQIFFKKLENFKEKKTASFIPDFHQIFINISSPEKWYRHGRDGNSIQA